MVLSVPFDGFAAACAHLDLPRVAWLQRVGARLRVTAADPRSGLLLRTETGMLIDACRSRLSVAGFECREGLWSSEAESEAQPSTSFWIAAVSYKSQDHKPGLWVDALPYRPNAGDVITLMFEEFAASGDLGDIDLESFIRLLEPNVVILDPEEQEQFALRHQAC